MVKYEDECVGCPKEMGCLGISCKYKNVPHYFCDNCGADEEDGNDIYEYEGEHLCAGCLLGQFEMVSSF